MDRAIEPCSEARNCCPGRRRTATIYTCSRKTTSANRTFPPTRRIMVYKIIWLYGLQNYLVLWLTKFIAPINPAIIYWIISLFNIYVHWNCPNHEPGKCALVRLFLCGKDLGVASALPSRKNKYWPVSHYVLLHHCGC